MGNCIAVDNIDTINEITLHEINANLHTKKDELNEINASLHTKKEELNEINANLHTKKEELNEINVNISTKKEELNEVNTHLRTKKEEINTNVKSKKEKINTNESTELNEINANEEKENRKLETYDLSNVNSSIKKFTLDGMNMWGKVVHVYDGDTVHIVFIINNTYSKFTCRMAHIDSPEMAPKNITDEKDRNKEKESAIRSRNYLVEQVTDMKITSEITKKGVDMVCETSKKLIWVKCFEFDKYGRLLVELYQDDTSTKSINSEMIDNRFAVPYEGKTKEIFDSSNFS
jgi:endonuclease YncB( thermonuclease family)